MNINSKYIFSAGGICSRTHGGIGLEFTQPPGILSENPNSGFIKVPFSTLGGGMVEHDTKIAIIHKAGKYVFITSFDFSKLFLYTIRKAPVKSCHPVFKDFVPMHQNIGDQAFIRLKTSGFTIWAGLFPLAYSIS